MSKTKNDRTYSEIQPLLPGELVQMINEFNNQEVADSRFSDYRSRRAEQTLRRQDADLSLFHEFLALNKIKTGDLTKNASAWRPVNWRLVEAFMKWQITQGYAIQSINVRLSSIKSYARLAMQGGTLLPQEYALIRAVQGYSPRDQHRIDQKRQVTRIGLKKAESIKLTPEQAASLKLQPNTPQGRRDTLLMCLLLDHGLRVGEVAALSVNNFNLEKQELHFFRPKTNKEQIQIFTMDTSTALKAYQDFGDMPISGLILRRSKKNEELGNSGMSERAITGRVCFLGEKNGISGLSAHDCRYFWSNSAARHGTNPLELEKDVKDWSLLAIPYDDRNNRNLIDKDMVLD